MANFSRVLALSLIAIALIWVNQAVSCEKTANQLEENESTLEAPPVASNKVQLKQSGLWPAFLFGRPARNKPNVFLIGIEPYYSMLPKPMQDVIDQQIRPQTDQLSEQILSSVPGAQQMYEQVSTVMSMFSQFIPSGGSGGGLSDLMGGFGKRR